MVWATSASFALTVLGVALLGTVRYRRRKMRRRLVANESKFCSKCLIYLCIRTHADVVPKKPEAIYCFSELPDNASSVFGAARAAVKRWPSIRVLITSEDGTRCPGFGGNLEMKAGLLAAGVPAANIELVPFAEEQRLIHTLNESEALVRYAAQRAWSRVLVSAPPFHQLRAFATAASVAVRQFSELQLYSYVGDSLRWDEEATHSQGAVRSSRARLLGGELQRIERYTSKGDIELAETLLAYLDRRDAVAAARGS